MRKTYDPTSHNYKDGDEIKMREIAPGHFVYCSEEEEVMYKEKHAKLTAEAAAK